MSERRAMQSQLAGIIGIELPAEDFEQVSDEEKADMARRRWRRSGSLMG